MEASEPITSFRVTLPLSTPLHKYTCIRYFLLVLRENFPNSLLSTIPNLFHYLCNTTNTAPFITLFSLHHSGYPHMKTSTLHRSHRIASHHIPSHASIPSSLHPHQMTKNLIQLPSLLTSFAKQRAFKLVQRSPKFCLPIGLCALAFSEPFVIE